MNSVGQANPARRGWTLCGLLKKGDWLRTLAEKLRSKLLESVPVPLLQQVVWLGALLAGCCLGIRSAAAQSAEPPAFKISSLELDTLSMKPPVAKELADALNSRQWCTAQPVVKETAWNEVPKGADRSQWVSFVTVGFNEQASAYAFMFNGPEGAMSLAAHLPFRQVPVSAYSIGWVWPVDGMLGTFRVDYERQASAGEKPTRQPLALKVIPWVGEETKPAVTTASSSKKSSLEEARTLDPELVFQPVSVITQGAAFEAGWAPTPGPAPWSATCEVRVEDSSCSFRLKLKGPQGEETFVKENVPWEQYHEHLVRVFRYAQSKKGVSDFTRLVRGRVDLLAVQDGKLACLLNQELTVFDLQSGKKLWTTEPPVKAPTYRPIDQYTTRSGSDGIRLLRYGRTLQELDWATGTPGIGSPVPADSAARFAPGAAQEWAGIDRGSLTLGIKDKVAWQHKQPGPITAGPLLLTDLVLTGDQTGLLQARLKSDGKIRWQQQLPGGLYGPLVAAGKQLYVFSSEVESLLALDSGSGTELWRRPVGDVLMQSPILVGQQLLLATKSNRLLLVEQASGAVTQERVWPTWIVSAEAFPHDSPKQVAVTDLAGVVSILSLPDLKTVRQVPLTAQVAGNILFVSDMPLRWPTFKPSNSADDDENLLSEIKDGPVQRGPAVLVTDAEGFLYILLLSSKE